MGNSKASHLTPTTENQLLYPVNCTLLTSLPMPDWLTYFSNFLISRPVILLAMLALPLYVVARAGNVFPHRRLLYFAMIPLAISVAMILHPVIGWYLLVADLVLIAVALIDLFSIVPSKHFDATRSSIHIVSLGKPQDVELELINRSKRSCMVRICDDLPESFTAVPAFTDARINGPGRVRFAYRCTPQQRGRKELEYVHVRVDSRWKLWRAFHKIPCPWTFNVYPDMKQITEYDLLARTNRLSLLGMRRSRKIGQDNEFERLRDYTQDDNFKHIDWRTTARRRKLTVRDYQTNQSQRIMFLVDCGRMMTGVSGNLTMLDHSLNAMLMLSYVALRQGDSVGMISFNDRICNYTPARGGVNQINRLLHASYDQQAAFVESRYDDAFLYLQTHCLKRSLVVLITNVIDEVNSFQIQQYLTAMSGRHLPLGVLLKDRDLYRHVDDIDPETAHPDKIHRAAAATDVIGWRQSVIRDLQHGGALTLDVFPEQLTTGLVNQYLDIKARHLL